VEAEIVVPEAVLNFMLWMVVQCSIKILLVSNGIEQLEQCLFFVFWISDLGGLGNGAFMVGGRYSKVLGDIFVLESGYSFALYGVFVLDCVNSKFEGGKLRLRGCENLSSGRSD
jgi:hypothetical protein